jgi:hypothetical protein
MPKTPYVAAERARCRRQMFGCSTAEAIGQPIDRFIPERFRAAHRDHIVCFGATDATTRHIGGSERRALPFGAARQRPPSVSVDAHSALHAFLPGKRAHGFPAPERRTTSEHQAAATMAVATTAIKR